MLDNLLSDSHLSDYQLAESHLNDFHVSENPINKYSSDYYPLCKGGSLRETHFKIIDVLIQNNVKSQTINQLSKKIGLNYSTIQKACDKLYSLKILNRRQRKKTGTKGVEGYLFRVNKKMDYEYFKEITLHHLKNEKATSYLSLDFTQQLLKEKQIIDNIIPNEIKVKNNALVLGDKLRDFCLKVIRISPSALLKALEKPTSTDYYIIRLKMAIVKDIDEGNIIQSDEVQYVETEITTRLYSPDSLFKQPLVSERASGLYTLPKTPKDKVKYTIVSNA